VLTLDIVGVFCSLSLSLDVHHKYLPIFLVFLLISSSLNNILSEAECIGTTTVGIESKNETRKDNRKGTQNKMAISMYEKRLLSSSNEAHNKWQNKGIYGQIRN
jgi:hypothetical protein